MIPVILLRGLGVTPLTLWPLEQYLRACGWTRTYRVAYPVNQHRLDVLVEVVDRLLQHLVPTSKSKSEPIVVIGQSMGGLIAVRLHTKGWTVHQAITIGSPLHGARLLRQLGSVMPRRIRNALYKVPYQDLMTKSKEPRPPHPVHTVSMGWACSRFDGCVYRDETCLDPDYHTHLAWADHRVVFVDPRLWRLVARVLRTSGISPGSVT